MEESLYQQIFKEALEITKNLKRIFDNLEKNFKKINSKKKTK